MIWTGVLALACGSSAHDGTQASASPETRPALERLATEAAMVGPKAEQG